ncbi:MAG: preprotein translocase subunit YajC [Mogibacterium sp.]|nr:preprotein translocase subunit YajC [Mogibacterium sp.]
MNSALLTQVGLLAVFVLMMYFMLIRPQKKREKETQQMRDALKKGDKVVTIGGIVGRISSVGPETVVIEVGKDRVKLEMLKSAIGNVVNGNAPLSDEKPSKPAKSEKDEEEDDAKDATVNRDRKISPKKLTGKKGGKKESAEEAVADVAAEVKEEVQE